MEYQVYQCNPDDDFDHIGGVICECDDLALAFTVTDLLWNRNPKKSYMIYQPRYGFSRGGSGLTDGE